MLDATPLSGAEVAEALALDEPQQRRLFAYARHKFGLDPDECRDILQETILEVLRTTAPIQRPRGFVFRVFHLRCSGLAGREQAEKRLGAALPRAPSSTGNDEHLALLRVAFAKLSPRCQALLRAYYLEGKSLRETAAEQALAYSGVWKLINRCLRRLKVCL